MTRYHRTRPTLRAYSTHSADEYALCFPFFTTDQVRQLTEALQ